MLSRQQMIETIRSGGSVLHGGRLITKEENLPTAASLAKTPEEKEVAAKDLDSQIEKLQAQRAALADKAAAEKEKADKDAADKAKALADKEAADKGVKTK